MAKNYLQVSRSLIKPQNTEQSPFVDVQDLVASLGDPMDLEPEPSSSQLPSNNSSYADMSQSVRPLSLHRHLSFSLRAQNDVPHARKRATTITSGPSTHSATLEPEPSSASFSRKRASTINPGLSDIINELVTTERSYVRRLRTLKSDYADPLRAFSRSKETAIVPPYEAKTLFGNIDQLLPVNEAFLVDLEKMLSPDGHEVCGVGDVALKHFKERKGFENYKQYYAKREEAQAIFEREVRKASGSGFSAFIDVRPLSFLFALCANYLSSRYETTPLSLPSPFASHVCATPRSWNIADQICGGGGQQESRRPQGTAHGAYSTDTTIHAPFSTDDKADAFT